MAIHDLGPNHQINISGYTVYQFPEKQWHKKPIMPSVLILLTIGQNLDVIAGSTQDTPSQYPFPWLDQESLSVNFDIKFLTYFLACTKMRI